VSGIAGVLTGFPSFRWRFDSAQPLEHFRHSVDTSVEFSVQLCVRACGRERERDIADLPRRARRERSFANLNPSPVAAEQQIDAGRVNGSHERRAEAAAFEPRLARPACLSSLPATTAHNGRGRSRSLGARRLGVLSRCIYHRKQFH
jgi:hypothetical protein